MPEARSFAPSRYSTLASNTFAEPIEERGFWGDLADTYALGVYGQIKDTLERGPLAPRDPNFDPLSSIPQGYARYAEDLRFARNQEDMDIMIANIDENNEIRARQQEYSFGYNLLLGAIAGVVDPVNVFGASVKGLSFFAGAAKGAFVYGSLNAGQEIIRNELDPTSTNTETAINIGAGYLLSGLVTGGAAYFSKTDVASTKIPPETYKKAQAAGDAYEEAIAATENLASPSGLRFGERDVKIVYGNTGKYDASGNYIPATFRSAEAAAERARAQRVSAAADSTLGDVIPDDEAAIATGFEAAPTAPATVTQNVPKYIMDNARDTVDALRRSNPQILNTVTDLHAQDLTAAEIAQQAGISIDAVRDIRLGLGLPDQGKGTAGISGAGTPADMQQRRAFEQWRDNYNAQKASGAAAPLAPAPAPAPAAPATPAARAADEVSAEQALEDTIYIDDGAILDSFGKKPWTSPRVPGVEPLPEDAFKTPDEWLNFVVQHELHYKTTKRLPNETKPEYENRINRLAYEDIQAGRAPLSPTDSFLETVMLAPTPQGRAMRLAPRNTYVHENLQNTAGDMATTMVGNRVGLPTTPGGSVFQKAQRWLVSNYILRVATDKAYVKYITGAEAKTAAGNAFEAWRVGLPIVGRARRENKLTPNEFRAYVGRASQTDNRFEMFGKPISDSEHQIIMQAASEARALFRQFGNEAEKLGMFEVQKRVARDIERLQTSIARRTERLEKYTGNLRTKIQAEIKDSEDQLAKLIQQQEDLKANPVMPSREKYYFPRIYDIGKIRAKREEFTKIIANHFGGDEAAMGRAQEWVAKVLNEGGDDFAPGAGGPANTLSRQITLTNEELADFIVWDSEIVMGVYSRRMGASIEMVKAFGSRMQEDLIDDMTMRLRDDGVPEERIAEIVRLQEDMRDRVLGRFHAKDPMSWDNRVARAIKNFTNITVMGRGIYAQVNDLARALAINGYAPLFKALHTAMRGEVSGLARGKYAKQAGEALELVNARWMASLVENDSALAVTDQTILERGLAAAQSPFFRFNLMNPFTTIWKDFTGIMSAHTLVDESVVLANAIRSGKTLNTLSKNEKRIADRLASFGIDVRSAQLIADMPFEKTDGGLYLANIENWTGRDGAKAKDVFLGALSGQIRTGVVTPGPLQRANIMDGVFYVKGKRMEQPLLSLPFQLLSFSLSSSAKVTHALLSGRDRQRAVTLASLYMSGMLASYLRAGDNWQYKTWEEVALESFESSAIAGYLTDVYKRTEDLTGFGPRAALGIEGFGQDTVSDEIGAVAGPGASVIAGAIEAFVNPDIEDRQRAGLIRRAIPFTGMWFWSDTLKEMSNWAADAGWIEGPAPDLSEFEGEEAVAMADESTPTAEPLPPMEPEQPEENISPLLSELLQQQ